MVSLLFLTHLDIKKKVKYHISRINKIKINKYSLNQSIEKIPYDKAIFWEIISSKYFITRESYYWNKSYITKKSKEFIGDKSLLKFGGLLRLFEHLDILYLLNFYY